MLKCNKPEPTKQKQNGDISDMWYVNKLFIFVKSNFLSTDFSGHARMQGVSEWAMNVKVISIYCEEMQLSLSWVTAGSPCILSSTYNSLECFL